MASGTPTPTPPGSARELFGPGWTRSLQRVEGVCVVVDQRPGMGLLIHAGGTDPQLAQPQMRMAIAAGQRLRDVWPTDDAQLFTVRVDSDVRWGQNDMVNMVARAIRQHLAAPLAPLDTPTPEHRGGTLDRCGCDGPHRGDCPLGDQR